MSDATGGSGARTGPAGAGDRAAEAALAAWLGPGLEAWLATGRQVVQQSLGLPESAVGTLFGFADALLRGATAAAAASPDTGVNADAPAARARGGRRKARPAPGAGSPGEGLPVLEQAYLTWCATLDDWLERSGLDGIERARALFVMRIFKDVLAPHNALVGNAAALQRARETGGESLRRGMRNFLDDLRHNHGYPAVANRHAFTVGVDVANTPGDVVLRTELVELIQYRPTTEAVHALPLVYVFSQVNRYYLGDLTSDRSLFRALLDAGITVFAVSWRNPTPAQRNRGLDSYVDGVIRAIDAARAVTGAAQVGLVGVCAGGVTAAVAAGVLKARGRADVASLSLFINILDNRPEDSDFGLWITEASVAAQKREVRNRGLFTEKQVFEMFAWLRPEENVMAFLRSNYLLGEAPPSHPLLFWSLDYTRMPARLHGDYLDLSLHNALARGALSCLGMRVDLAQLACPAYVMAGSTDHITPWPACYRTMSLLGGPREFVLTNQNHTQTICARDDNRHLRYWRNPALPTDAAAWQAGAQEVQGHWRTHWIDWLRAHSGALREAPAVAGSARFPPLGPAPGTYVLER
jgi:polyhydroxyalkanoate synthase